MKKALTPICIVCGRPIGKKEKAETLKAENKKVKVCGFCTGRYED